MPGKRHNFVTKQKYRTFDKLECVHCGLIINMPHGRIKGRMK